MFAATRTKKKPGYEGHLNDRVASVLRDAGYHHKDGFLYDMRNERDYLGAGIRF